ncbi:MAG TPA: acyl-CoA dehydrogenase family protein [Caulifigura sp.]|nr:acyl-CoA dehydrogenase family protein [Caulifigura sp.]
MFRQAGVTAWTVPRDDNGAGFSSSDVLAGCIELARADLVSTFVLSQFQSAISRFIASSNTSLSRTWLPALALGDAFATVGISHLTTSRQHVQRPAVLAETSANGYLVTGEIPWVTSGGKADVLVAGASLDDGRQILFALPTSRPGVKVADGWPLLALTGSSTGPVHLDEVAIGEGDLLAGPIDKVLQQGLPGGAGSLTTSALALGHALHCVDRIRVESEQRPALTEIVEAFEHDLDDLRDDLLAAARGAAGPEHTADSLRTRATSQALATSQSLLTATKGAGFVTGHPAERLAREAMFFLVWSCPQAVSSRLLREFSQCEAGL